MTRPKTIYDYLGCFAASERARAAGLEPAATETALRTVLEIGGEADLLYGEYLDPIPAIATFREWHATRVLVEFEEAEKLRQYDPNYLQTRMNHLVRAFKQDGLRGLFKIPPETVTAEWDYSANYQRTARSVLGTLRFWYTRMSGFSRLARL